MNESGCKTIDATLKRKKPVSCDISRDRQRRLTMDELKKQLAEMCERELDYYDIVNESNETVEYGLIIDFLFERLAERMQGRSDRA